MIRPRAPLRLLTRTPLTEYARRGKMRLDKNERLVPDAALARDVLRAVPLRVLTEYPDYGPFRAFLARRLRCRPDNLLLTAGSDGAIKLAFEAYVDRGDEVVLPSPSFAMFGVYAALAGARVRAVPFADDLSFPTEKVLAAIGRRTKLVPIATPNNPTGTEIDDGDLDRIVRRAARFGALVLVDEAYYYFTRRTHRALALRHDNVVLTRTFSKALGLAGLRIGFACGRPGVIKNMRKCQPIFEVNGLALRFAEYVLRHEPRAWAYAAQVEEGKAYLGRALGALGFPVRRAAGNFILVEAGSGAAGLARRLADRGVTVGSGYTHPSLRQKLKVTVGPVAVMRRFVSIFRRVVGSR
ncbi:MAG: histidinol-phosphate aminotransferase family protein [Elusimicrobia bacterium]|nr:histidinol-phosphate aminotransferase family protein [Elusimicrobiota bacterium]